ncbi:MAG TPA: FG-GAP-like repeat-containing protein, partial [Verrucomicrobiae bacterium]|nr:FG-GAP-like repeat-containing protein [Verrucomicrobiae bacterium]
FYINGVLDNTIGRNPRRPLRQTADNVFIGRQGRTCNCNYFRGQIDELRVWNIARPGAEIQRDMHRELTGRESGSVAYFQFNEGNSVTAWMTGRGLDGASIFGFGWNWAAPGAPVGMPKMIALPPTDLTTTSVRLNGIMNARGQNGEAFFRIGLSAGDYFRETAHILYLNNWTDVTVAPLVSTLLPNRTYHYEFVVRNSAGEVTSGDLTFNTGEFPDAGAALPGLSSSAVDWGDYNNDGLLDLLLTGDTASGDVAQVWRNRGNDVLTNIGVGLPGVRFGAVAWGDYDNDGFLDILLTGQGSTGNVAQVWRNLGNGTFADVNAPLRPVNNSAVAWGDFDNDGRLDILLTGDSFIDDHSARLTDLWRNEGNGTFTKMPVALTGIGYGSVAVADFDRDGRLDIVLTGLTDGFAERRSELWRNLGDWQFTNMNVELPPMRSGTVALGDLNRDGELDLVLTGLFFEFPSRGRTEVWLNAGNWTFTNALAGLRNINGSVALGDVNGNGTLDLLLTGFERETFANVSDLLFRDTAGTYSPLDIGLPALSGGSAAMVDADNDRRLDLFLCGRDATQTRISQLRRNIQAVYNQPPGVPPNLRSLRNGRNVTLLWDAASDLQTPAAGLTYNVRVGRAPGGYDVVSPNAHPVTGARRLAKIGNTQNRLNAHLERLLPGTYYWSVQAIDGAYAGSVFAPESSFVVPALISTIVRRPEGGFRVEFLGVPNRTYTVQYSADLTSWSNSFPVTANTTGFAQFEDAPVQSPQKRFYRLRDP